MLGTMLTCVMIHLILLKVLGGFQNVFEYLIEYLLGGFLGIRLVGTHFLGGYPLNQWISAICVDIHYI